MANGRSKNPFAHILRFVYFTLSACSLVWMLASYGGVNFLSTMILLPAFGYLALHLISLINVVKKDNFLVGSSVDVLSLGAQKMIHRIGLILPLPILLYVATFGLCVITYNEADATSTARVNEFSGCEQTMFGKSVIWSYLSDRAICRMPEVTPAVVALEPVSAEPAAAAETVDNVRGDIDYQPWMNDLEKRVKRSWFPPKCSESEHATVAFKVARDGHVSELKIISHSSTKLSDEAALKAVKNAQPFRPLPEGSKEKVDVEFSFDYNVLHADDTVGTDETLDQFTSYGIESQPISN